MLLLWTRSRVTYINIIELKLIPLCNSIGIIYTTQHIQRKPVSYKEWTHVHQHTILTK